MEVQVYVNFEGNCREAVTFYADVFNQPLPEFMTYGSMPSDPSFPLPAEAKDLIMHTDLKIGDSLVMFADVPPGMPLTVGDNITLVVVSKNMDEIRNLFSKLKEEGTVEMDLQETF